MTMNLIATLRKNQGITARELAQRRDLHPSELSRYENGLRPSPARAQRIAQALGTHPDSLWPPGRQGSVMDRAMAIKQREREAVAA
jgi:transcriptional regulator with XRE-family HTH domain